MAISILAIAGSALLLSVDAALLTSEVTIEEMIADGMAQQLMDEISGKLYMAQYGDPYQYPLCPNSYELTSQGRELYDDSDDFHGYQAQPAEDMYGVEMGQGTGTGGLRHPNFRLPSGYFSDWRQEVEVYYVSEVNPAIRLPNGTTSDMRAVEVTIYRQNTNGGYVELSRRRQVFSYFPPTN